MYIQKTLSTQFGRCLVAEEPGPVRVTLSHEEIHILAVALERRAVEAEREGCFGAANHLAGRAATLRRVTA